MSIIVPLYKREEQDKVENYKRISLLCSAYKVYTEILKKRLEKEEQEKGLLRRVKLVLGKEDLS